MSETIHGNISSVMTPAQYNLSDLRPSSMVNVQQSSISPSSYIQSSTNSSDVGQVARSSTPTRISLTNKSFLPTSDSKSYQNIATLSPVENNYTEIIIEVEEDEEPKNNKLKFDCINGYAWLNDKAFWGFVIVSLISVIIGWIAGIGNLNENWYENLTKPSYMPPSYVTFAIWVVFNFITAYLGYAGYRQARTEQERNISTLLYIIQLVLNLVWIILLFGQENPAGSFWVAILAFVTVLLWMLLLARINKTLAIIALAFLVWIGFTIAFNWEIVTLNKV